MPMARGFEKSSNGSLLRTGLLASLGAGLAGCISLITPDLEEAADDEARHWLAPGVYKVTPANSKVTFAAGPTPLGLIEGEFTAFSGTLDMRDPEEGIAVLEATLQVDSIELPGGLFRDMLLGPRWFDAANWPEIRFAGRLADWQGNGTGDLHGTMTIRNETRRETFMLVLTCDGLENCPEDVIGYQGLSTVDRTQYGMTAMQGLAGNDVLITVSGRLEMENVNERRGDE